MCAISPAFPRANAVRGVEDVAVLVPRPRPLEAPRVVEAAPLPRARPRLAIVIAGCDCVDGRHRSAIIQAVVARR